MPRFAANLTMMYTEHAFLDRFAAAAADGFSAVEFLFPYEFPAETLARLLKQNGLRQVLFNAPPGDWKAGERGITALPGREQEFREGFQRALDYAVALACPRIHCMAGLAPSGAERARMRATYLENLAWAADLAAPAGVEILIEPIAQRNIPGFFINLQEEAHAVIAELARPNLKVLMDLFHCQVAEGDLATRIRRYLAEPSRVGHFQIASVPARHEPDTGEVRYEYLFDLLDELGYKGWIGCEYAPESGTSAGLGWFRKLQPVAQ
ncbi:MAG TPA: 2-oxo-tetronate isomerase [Terracidiphilus sp.]|nr:2-oxo-tetronate isomerase [Terracidiphilus sp.]